MLPPPNWGRAFSEAAVVRLFVCLTHMPLAQKGAFFTAAMITTRILTRNRMLYKANPAFSMAAATLWWSKRH